MCNRVLYDQIGLQSHLQSLASSPRESHTMVHRETNKQANANMSSLDYWKIREDAVHAFVSCMHTLHIASLQPGNLQPLATCKPPVRRAWPEDASIAAVCAEPLSVRSGGGAWQCVQSVTSAQCHRTAMHRPSPTAPSNCNRLNTMLSAFPVQLCLDHSAQYRIDTGRTGLLVPGYVQTKCCSECVGSVWACPTSLAPAAAAS